jgi:hypothetical protein
MAVHPGSIWLDNNWTRLPPGYWVAADHSGVVAEDRVLDRVVASLARQKIDPDAVTITYVPEGIVQ